MEQRCPVVLGVSGSLRSQSSNTRLLTSIEGLLPAGAEFRLYDGLADLPHFNPDLDGEGAVPPKAVHEWREQLRAADAVIICTPEYAHGVPGSLKNALDWAVSSGEFMNKPAAVISASPHPDGGAAALASLTETLKMMNAGIQVEATIAIPFIGKKLGPDGSISDANTLSSLHGLVQALLQAAQRV